MYKKINTKSIQMQQMQGQNSRLIGWLKLFTKQIAVANSRYLATQVIAVHQRENSMPQRT